MRFKFPSGEEVSLPIGHKLVGFIRAGRRPCSVSLDRKELLYLKRNYTYHRMLEQSLELDAASIREEVAKMKEDALGLFKRQSGGLESDKKLRA